MKHLMTAGRVFRARTRANEKCAGREGGLNGKVTYSVRDKPDVSRPRHSSGGRREIVDEMREATELVADGWGYEKIVDLIFVVLIVFGRSKAVEEERIVEGVTCIGEAKGIFSRASSVDHELRDALSLVSSIREHLVQPVEETLLVLLGNHFKRPWRHKICKALIDLVVEFYPRVQVSPCTPKLPWTFRALPCRQCTRKGRRRSQTSNAHDEEWQPQNM